MAKASAGEIDGIALPDFRSIIFDIICFQGPCVRLFLLFFGISKLNPYHFSANLMPKNPKFQILDFLSENYHPKLPKCTLKMPVGVEPIWGRQIVPIVRGWTPDSLRIAACLSSCRPSAVHSFSYFLVNDKTIPSAPFGSAISRVPHSLSLQSATTFDELPSCPKFA